MAKNLVIVESPSKSKTIKKYLGNNFEVLASYGHVRDLEPRESSIDVRSQFKMRYEPVKHNKRHIDAIRSAAKSSDRIYLATDPDREGEAISWHIYEILNENRLIENKPVHRIAFNEITKSAIMAAIANPRDLAINLVNAQQARRALDFLVGFKLSPLLWKKVRRGLSAGRVQSPTLRMIVEKEVEIEKFQPKDFWSINVKFKGYENVIGRLSIFNREKCNQFSFPSKEALDSALMMIKEDAKEALIIQNIEKKQRIQAPLSPFTTSTLQQNAVSKLGFTTKKTMMLAQQLYEGIELGNEGSVGLITYMRTDSTGISKDALVELRRFIKAEYGKSYLPLKPSIYQNKKQNIQEAHESIRPASVYYQPRLIKDFLSSDQLKLYELIWQRTVACQMISASINIVTISFITDNGAHTFKTSESIIANPGFLRISKIEKDEDSEILEDIVMSKLSKFRKGDIVKVLNIDSKKHSTCPPKRYTESSLVKTLEEYGIGRPSTYATIISTLLQRNYVVLEKRHFKPTEVGRIVNEFLTNYFYHYVEYNFTSKLENELDDIAEGKVDWIPVLKSFWKPFIEQVTKISTNIKRSDITNKVMDEKCLNCGHKLSMRLGRNGSFIGCTNYPDCTYTRPVVNTNSFQSMKVEQNQSNNLEAQIVSVCPKCKSNLLIKQGRYSKFIGCSNYPTCKHIETLNKPEDTGVQCQKCKEGKFFKKKSRKGKVFYSCSEFPKCKNSFWNLPVAKKCPKCNSPVLLDKTLKETEKRQRFCPNNNCNYIEFIQSEKESS